MRAQNVIILLLLLNILEPRVPFSSLETHKNDNCGKLMSF